MSSSPSKTPHGTSPGRRTRLQEKEELQHLNDRFVTYIDRVRKLREEKARLDLTVEHLQTSTEEESGSVKRMFEKELEATRVMIDEISKEKAKYEILAMKHSDRVEELESIVKNIQDDLARASQELEDTKRNMDTLDSQRKMAMKDKVTAEGKLQDLEYENEELRNQVSKDQETLEEEALKKVDLENQIKSLKEDIAFKKKYYEDEITRVRRTGSKTTLTYRDGVEENEDDFAERLYSAIDEAREEIEKETEQYRNDIEKAYRAKLEMLENQAVRDASTITRLNNELRQLNSLYAKANNTISKLQQNVELLENALRDKEEELGKEKQDHAEDVSRLMEEMRTLRVSFEEKMREYEDLLDVRVRLEQEIATLSALLQEEEARLQLSTPTREKRQRTQTESDVPRSKRRKQVSAKSSSAAGFLQISEVDVDGRYVQIRNSSDHVEPLSGFRIVHEVETTGEKVEFRFHSKSKIHGGSSVTVWAAAAEGATHSPPGNIIWKSVPNWGHGPKTLTSLCTKSGEVVATFTLRKETTTTETTPPEYVMDETDPGAHSFPTVPEVSPVRVQEATPIQSDRPLMQEVPPPQAPPTDPGDQKEKCIIS